MFYREGFTENSYSFYIEIISLVEDFCTWLEEKGMDLDSDLSLALTSYFALEEIKDEVDGLIEQYQRLPVFEGAAPEEAYKKWRKENAKIIRLKKNPPESGEGN